MMDTVFSYIGNIFSVATLKDFQKKFYNVSLMGRMFLSVEKQGVGSHYAMKHILFFACFMPVVMKPLLL